MLLSILSRGAVVLFVGLSAAAAQTPQAAPSPSQAVQEFMQAIADSNLTRMAQLFGTPKGSSFRTHQPENYEKRMVTIQLFLRGVKAHPLGNLPGKDGRRVVTTELGSHNGCSVTLPVTTAKAKEGWLVEAFDLAQAAQINRACDNGRSGNGGH